MSDDVNLNIAAKLRGASKVESGLRGLERATKGVEKAAAGAVTNEKSLTDALREKSAAAEQSLKKTEDLFKATERLAGIFGKVSFIIGAATLAYKGMSWIVRQVNDDTDAFQATIKNQALALRNLAFGLGVVEAGFRGVSDAARSAGLLTGLSFTSQEAVALREVGEGLEQLREKGRDGLTREERVLREVTAAQAALNAARANDPNTFDGGRLSEAKRQRDLLEAEITTLHLRRDKIISDARGRFAAPKGPTGGDAAKPAGPEFPELNSTALGKLIGGAKPGDEDLFGIGPQVALFDEMEMAMFRIGIAARTGLGAVGETLRDMYAPLAKIQAQIGNFGKAIAADFGAAALSALFLGSSLKDAIGGVAEMAAQEAAFGVVRNLAKAAEASSPPPFGNPLAVGFHIKAAALYGALGVAAGAVAKVARGGGGGGGAGASTFGRAPNRRDLPGGGGDDGQTYNVKIDFLGMPLATEQDVESAVYRAINRGARRRGGPRLDARAVRG